MWGGGLFVCVCVRMSDLKSFRKAVNGSILCDVMNGWR